MADAETIGAEHADRAATLVERTAQVSGFTQVDAVDLDFRTRVDVEGGPVIDGRDLNAATGDAEVREQELATVHREARASRFNLDASFGHIGGTADVRDRADDLASAERVAIGAVEAQESQSRAVAVHVHGNRTGTDGTRRAAGAHIEGRLASAAAVIDPNIAQRVGTRVVRARQEDITGGAAADDEDVGGVRRSQGARDRSVGRVIGGNLRVAVQCNRAGHCRAVDTEGAEARVAGIILETQRGDRDTTVSRTRVSVAPARDGHVVRERATGEVDLRTVTDDDVGAAEVLGVVDRDTGRAAVGVGAGDNISCERK